MLSNVTRSANFPPFPVLRAVLRSDNISVEADGLRARRNAASWRKRSVGSDGSSGEQKIMKKNWNSSRRL
jgi:hypothetical protein